MKRKVLIAAALAALAFLFLPAAGPDDDDGCMYPVGYPIP
jgi:hypothetical protein